MLQLQKTAPRGVTIAAAAHGQGLFATNGFQRGQFVGWMEGQVICDDGYSSDYCVDLGNGNCLEPEGPLRYLNHSCEPNCELYLIEIDERGATLSIPRISVETISSISNGEELTIDYGWPAEQAIRCGCGANDCRGWIVAEDELQQLPKQSRRTAI